MAKSSIEWTDETWNPTTGCTKISQGCKFCYAEIMHRRLRAMGQEKYSQPFTIVRSHADELNRPFTWKKPRTVFVNSMSDLFHVDIPFAFIKRVFKVMNDTPQHTYQVLTKRADLLLLYAPFLTWTPNIWMGVSVEDNPQRWRITDLRKTPAQVKFLSCEPLIGPLTDLDLTGIHWVIVGGESGRKPRPMQEDWVLDILHKCQAMEVPFFFKQWGGINKKASGRLLNGREYNELPFPYLLNK